MWVKYLYNVLYEFFSVYFVIIGYFLLLIFIFIDIVIEILLFIKYIYRIDDFLGIIWNCEIFKLKDLSILRLLIYF